MSGKNLIFYDGTCGLCDHIVQFLLKHDPEGIFVFAPLQGSTAQTFLKDLDPKMKEADSLILVEDYTSPDRKYYVFGKAAFRICWLLGGFWALLGLISFLPSFLYDWGYRLVARNRHRFFQSCVLPTRELQDRFLP